jgi:hypothetical protein
VAATGTSARETDFGPIATFRSICSNSAQGAKRWVTNVTGLCCRGSGKWCRSMMVFAFRDAPNFADFHTAPSYDAALSNGDCKPSLEQTHACLFMAEERTLFLA